MVVSIDEKEFTGRIPTRIFVIDTWFSVKSWIEVKVFTYKRILKENPDITIKGSARISSTKYDFRNPISLGSDLYIEGNLSAKDIVLHCQKAIVVAGFVMGQDLKIETKDVFY